MPGKVNPTQSEVFTMLSVQVMADDVAIGFRRRRRLPRTALSPVIGYAKGSKIAHFALALT